MQTHFQTNYRFWPTSKSAFFSATIKV